MNRSGIARGILVAGVALGLARAARAAEPPASFESLAADFTTVARPVLKAYCLECHDADTAEGELDLDHFASLAQVRQAVPKWQKVAEMLDTGEMPPKDARRIPAEARTRLRDWLARYLRAEASASAGDPGPVVLRRLSNAQYTDSIQDLTGLDLQPAREFPADGAAGEGFTNTGNALVMSPALLTKYFDAAKGVAAHAMLVPDGLRFTPGTSRRDWTDETLAAIRAFYGQYANPEGRLDLLPYLKATLEERDALRKQQTTLAEVARARKLNLRYLTSFWTLMNQGEASQVVQSLRNAWERARPGDAPALATEFGRWQEALSRFQSVGHMKPWVVPVDPVATQQELRYKFVESADPSGEVSFRIAVGDAGDGHAGDLLVLHRPRLVLPGRPDLLLRDVRSLTTLLTARREKVAATAARCLAAAAEVAASTGKTDVAALATKHQVDPDVLAAWLDYLGIGSGAPLHLDLFTTPLHSVANYPFVNGWGRPETPNLVANSSDNHVRVPGNLPGHGVAMHPAPTLAVAVGWKSPVDATLAAEGLVTHAHPECGNGVTWSLELRRGATRQRLASGIAAGARPVKVGPVDTLSVRKGDLISLVVGPRDGNHACDLTDVSLVLRDPSAGGRSWDLAADVSPDVTAANPHADRQGNPQVWHFYTEPVQGGDGTVIPAGSLLARWLATPDPAQKTALANQIQALLAGGPPAAKEHPDHALHRQIASLGGPLIGGLLRRAVPTGAVGESRWGLDPARFGRLPDGNAIDPADLCIPAPAVVEFRLPADLVTGSDLVASADLADEAGSVQLAWDRAPIEPPPGLKAGQLVLVGRGAAVRERFERAFGDARRWFPAALCYTKIVPVDEVVTLTLFHREDDVLRRLMLDDGEAARIDRLWNELHFVSQDALTLVDAFAQLMEYATQDSDPKLFEPYRKPIHDRAAAFRKTLAEAEPRQVEAVLEIASKAFRRPLRPAEADELRQLYRTLRSEELPHDEAVRLLLARVLIAPAFLYRVESPGSGASPAAVDDWELASRLSYFLWSSLPDDELRAAAASGKLHEPDVLAAQTRRMLRDPKVRRLATEFACQWLHVYDFDTLDEKSERHFPTFVGIRGALYEETIRFFTDLFQSDARVVSIYDADHTFLNEALAQHYGIPGVTGAEWRKVEGVKKYGRGGILGLSTTLAKQSGASRTSPILRGNWVSEVLLGERLPRPPKGVPQLPDDESSSGERTVRQLVEMHSRDPKCIGCHRRIDPLGFALESYDAIGRLRDKDLGNRPIDTHAKLADGTEFDGLNGLRSYLLTTRRDAVIRQFNRKLLGYALGRGVQLSDEPLLDELRRQVDTGDGRIGTLVETIVRSQPFRMIRGREAALVSQP
ncbi:MAG: DUF1592 domain-containing protein [Isosphaeraceae bacterium]